MRSTSRTFRVWQPRGPDKTEVWSWVFCDKAAPAEVKEQVRLAGVRGFSPSGTFEQDDMDNWQECTRTCRGVVSRRMALNNQMGMGHERWDEALGAWASELRISESNQRQFYNRWAELMAAESWAALGGRNATSMDDLVVREVERFLYREARLLDERRFHEWLELFTEDVRYWMVTRADRYPKSSKAVAALDPGWAAAEPENDDALAILDESKATLAGRVARLETGMAWAEDPPSRTRHIIANIEVEPGDAAAELVVHSNYIVYKSRAETEQDFYVGARRDLLRRVEGGLKIARRKLTLDQNVLLAKNVSIFF